jgi:hypothetical protein
MDNPHRWLKELQQAVRESEGRKPSLKELLALSTLRDPFNAGSEADIAKAEWFAEALGDTYGAHLRRVHYRLVSRGNVMKPDGGLYENDKKSWGYLQEASRLARYLGKVAPERLVDRRNPAASVHMTPYSDLFDGEWSHELTTYRLARISSSLRNDYPPLVAVEAELGVFAYQYASGLQPYHVEVWAEKTTMNDILAPLCTGLGVNFVPGAGYQSITAMVALLRERVASLKKPARILYVSDYDAAGRNMPKQMARHIEFWSEKYAPEEADIRVEPIVLTAEQAADYPAAPDSGAVELDAMEELTPGRLERIVRSHIEVFRDLDLSYKVRETRREAEEALQSAVDDAIADDLGAVEEIKAEAEEIYGGYRERLAELASELDSELAPLDERLREAQQAVREKIEALEPDFPDLPEPESPEAEDASEDWLFESGREYLEQLEYYKRGNEDE